MVIWQIRYLGMNNYKSCIPFKSVAAERRTAPNGISKCCRYQNIRNINHYHTVEPKAIANTNLLAVVVFDCITVNLFFLLVKIKSHPRQSMDCLELFLWKFSEEISCFSHNLKDK